MAGSIQDETAGLLSSLTSDAQLRLYYASDSDSDDDLAEQDDDMVMDGILLCEKGHVPEPSDDKAMAARRQSVDSLGAPRRGSASASSATISTPAIITHSTPAKSKQSLSTATTTTTTTTAPNNRRFSDARPQVMGPASTTSKKIISLPSILTTSLQRYETILSTLPSSPPHPIAPSEKHSRKPSRNFTGCAAPMNNDDISYDELQPLSETWQPQRSGHLWIQKRDDKWNYAWCSHMGMRFRYQDTPTSTSWHEYTILYVAYHPIENRRRENAVILQPEQTWFYFQLYTPEQIYQCRAASDADAIAWMTSISRVIRVMYNDNEWAEKNRAAARWHSMMMKCYEYELRRYTKMLYRIAHAGLIDARFQQNGNNDTVFAGHLCLSERTDSTWTDYYMLLCDTTLLYFQSSKEREPTGVIVLRYATVTLEESPLRRGECIICIKTPLKRFYLKLKHSVVAAEWLFSFERVMRPNDVQFGSAQAVLDRINAVQNDLSHLSACIQHPDGLTAFRSFVTDPIHQNQLRFWRDLERYLTYRLPEKERKTLSDSISLRITQSLERLKSSQSPDSPSSSSLSLPFDLDPSFIQTLQDTKQLQDVVTKTMQQLSQLQSRIVTSLEKLYFTDFKQSPGYKTLQISIQQSSSTPPTTAPDSPPTIDPSDLERDNTDSTNGKRSISKSSSPSSQHTSSHAIPSDPSFNPDTTKLVVKWLRKACGTQAEKWKTQTYYLWPDQTHVLIGRASSNHIVIHDTGLSRSHGRIEWDQNGMLYIDLGSSFGTKREGVALMKGRVYVGETLHMGKYCTLKIDRCDANDMKAKKRKQQKCSIM